MTAKKADAPVSNAPMTYRDYPGEVPASDPVVALVATQPEPVAEPGKPVTKKEN